MRSRRDAAAEGRTSLLIEAKCAANYAMLMEDRCIIAYEQGKQQSIEQAASAELLGICSFSLRATVLR
jgi:hypothetical protein